MGAKRLQTAAEAAGYAMVNPDDFGGEPAMMSEPGHSTIDIAQHVTSQSVDQPAPKSTSVDEQRSSWLSWDYFRLTGRAPA